MSAENLFIIKENFIEGQGLEKVANDLIRLGLENNFGVIFNACYMCEELLRSLKIGANYFYLTDSYYIPNMESFDENNFIEELKYIPKQEILEKENELLLEKFGYLNKIVEIIFGQSNVKSIDFYVSHSKGHISDYKTRVVVTDNDLTNAFVKRLQPCDAKYEKYFGLKTTVFNITR